MASQPESEDHRELPDPAICRAKHIGLRGYAECLVERPFHCRFATPFGLGFYCRHPERGDIIARTADGQGK